MGDESGGDIGANKAKLNERRLSLLLTHIYVIQDWRVFIDPTGIYDGLGWVFAEEIEEVRQMTDGHWGWGSKLNAIYWCVYQRTRCQLGWRERVKGLQPDIIMRSQNKPGKANIIQRTYCITHERAKGTNTPVLYHDWQFNMRADVDNNNLSWSFAWWKYP